jgi:hypothetical protein
MASFSSMMQAIQKCGARIGTDRVLYPRQRSCLGVTYMHWHSKGPESMRPQPRLLISSFTQPERSIGCRTIPRDRIQPPHQGCGCLLATRRNHRRRKSDFERKITVIFAVEEREQQAEEAPASHPVELTRKNSINWKPQKIMPSCSRCGSDRAPGAGSHWDNFAQAARQHAGNVRLAGSRCQRAASADGEPTCVVL